MAFNHRNVVAWRKLLRRLCWLNRLDLMSSGRSSTQYHGDISPWLAEWQLDERGHGVTSGNGFHDAKDIRDVPFLQEHGIQRFVAQRCLSRAMMEDMT